LFLVSKLEARRICNGLKEQAIFIETCRLLGLKNDLKKQLDDPYVSEDEKEPLRSKIISIKQKIDNLDSEEIFYLPPISFDWHKLSVQNVWFLN
jgi:hypothetical protein